MSEWIEGQFFPSVDSYIFYLFSFIQVFDEMETPLDTYTIILPEVKYQDMLLLTKFMYGGEVTVPLKQLGTLQDLIQLLQLEPGHGNSGKFLVENVHEKIPVPGGTKVTIVGPPSGSSKSPSMDAEMGCMSSHVSELNREKILLRCAKLNSQLNVFYSSKISPSYAGCRKEKNSCFLTRRKNSFLFPYACSQEEECLMKFKFELSSIFVTFPAFYPDV